MSDESSITITNYFKRTMEVDSLYVNYQKYCGLTYAEFWCIFTVFNDECQYQHEISETLYMSKQTVNSVLKKLEKIGYISLLIPPENHRVRKIVLTGMGITFCQKYFTKLEELEKRAWDYLSKDEQVNLLATVEKLNNALRVEIQEAIK